MTDIDSKERYRILMDAVRRNSYYGKPAPSEREIRTIAVSHGRLSKKEYKQALTVALDQREELERFEGPNGRQRLVIAEDAQIQRARDWLHGGAI